MMLHGFTEGGLELRQEKGGAAHISGRFPYGARAVLSRGGRTGRPRKEVIAPRAFRYRVETPSSHGGKKEIHLLAGHSFDHPLASVRNGTLKLRDTEEALFFTAVIVPELQEAPYVRDFLAGLAAGLVAGISPGFAIPPKETVPDAESVAEEDPAEGRAIIRTVHDALLYEISGVTRPAYPTTQIEARNWEIADEENVQDFAQMAPGPKPNKVLRRWLL